MMKAFDRTARNAATAGLAAALVLLPPGIVPAQARSDGTMLQLAQGPGPGVAPPRGAGGPQVPGGAKPQRATPRAPARSTARSPISKQLKITRSRVAIQRLRGCHAQQRAGVGRADEPGSPNPNPNAVESLKREQQLTETQAAGLKRLVPALQSLYNALSDPQKKTADKIIGGGGDTGPGPGPQRGGRG
jgi:hypothetical protein